MRTRPVIYPAGYPVFGGESAPPDTVLENFESIAANLPNGGIITWHSIGTPGVSYTLTGSPLHVTQGTQSGLFTDILSGGITTSGSAIDLTSYNTILIDVYVSSLGGSPDFFIMEIYDSGSFDEVGTTPADTTGAFTVSVDISSAPDKNDLAIDLVSSQGTSAVFYLDNLRGEP